LAVGEHDLLQRIVESGIYEKRAPLFLKPLLGYPRRAVG